jgi:hypothetical protein
MQMKVSEFSHGDTSILGPWRGAADVHNKAPFVQNESFSRRERKPTPEKAERNKFQAWIVSAWCGKRWEEPERYSSV